MKGLIVMPVYTPAGSTTVASGQIGRYLESLLGWPLMQPKNSAEFADASPNIALFIGGTHSFCDEAHRDRMANIYARARRVIYAENDYAIPLLPKAARVARNLGKPPIRWTTLEHKLANPSDRILNWNRVAYRPLPDQVLGTRRQPGLVYWGACRRGREERFAEYLGEGITYPAVVSTGGHWYHWRHVGKEGRKDAGARFAELAAGAEFVKKFQDLIPEIARYQATLYIEDPKTSKHGEPPAMRFYEALSAGVAVLIDEASAGTFTRAGYDVERYVVRSRADVARKLKRARAIARDQAAAWRRDYAGELKLDVQTALHLARKTPAQPISASAVGLMDPIPKRLSSREARTSTPGGVPMKRQKNHAAALRRAFELSFVRRFVKPSMAILDLGPTFDAAAVMAETPKKTPSRYVALTGKKAVAPDFTWVEIIEAPLTEDIFDVIIALEVDEKPKEMKKLLKTAAAMLAPGGRLFIAAEAPPSSVEVGLVEEIAFGIDVGENRAELLEHLSPGEKAQLKVLDRVMDSDVAERFLAALHPEACVRSVYVLRRVDDEPLTAEEIRHAVGATPKDEEIAREAIEKTKKPQRKVLSPKQRGSIPAKELKKAVREVAQSRKKRPKFVDPKPARETTPAKEKAAATRGDKPKNRAPRERSTASTKEGEFATSGEYIRHLLKAGVPDEEILKRNLKAFPWSKAKQSDIKWNRRKLDEERK